MAELLENRQEEETTIHCFLRCRLFHDMIAISLCRLRKQDLNGKGFFNCGECSGKASPPG
jgi:hypothetical protein